TLYFALTGQPPFPGGNALEKIKRHLSEEPVPVSQLNPAVPAGFADLLRKMMAKRPEERFGSAVEVCHELLTWTSDDCGAFLDLEPAPNARAVGSVLGVEEIWARLAAETEPAFPPAPPKPRWGRFSWTTLLQLAKRPVRVQALDPLTFLSL